MRNLNQELLNLGLSAIQSESVLNWLNTITNEDLEDNGSEHWRLPPPGDGSYEHEYLPDDYHLLENQIARWIEKNLPIFKKMDKNPDVSGKIQFAKAIKNKFDLTLIEAKNILDKNWYK